jgi:hypothetical protein
MINKASIRNGKSDIIPANLYKRKKKSKRGSIAESDNSSNLLIYIDFDMPRQIENMQSLNALSLQDDQPYVE